MNLSVVIPVRDEAGNVAPLAAEIVQAVPGRLSYEVIFVDDGSTDATPAELVALQGDHSCVRVLRHRQSCGQSAAIRTGLQAAEGDWIATLDGDGQNDPADIPHLWSTMQDWQGDPPLGLVAGQRTRRRDSAIKRLSSRMANGVRRRLLDDGVIDTGCGVKLMRRDAVLMLPFFDHMHRFLPALIQAHGWACQTVPVNHRPRGTGRSKYGTLDRLWVGIFDLFGVFWLIRRIATPEIETPASEARP